MTSLGVAPSETAARLAPALLAWAKRHGRRDLPWQRQRTPYRVWISEVMLQQTQVSTARAYFERF
ncbi:MAG TPA: A/G-specific adenine glycosylase, partial [Dehalococcoidia bacterium]|nr:A/G-specific adenine glycosylase [Dehalococcoidia bacterium]